MQTALSYDRRRTASEPDDEIIDLQELQVADYVVFLLALDTYMGWLYETQGNVSATDPILAKGLTLAKFAERQNLDSISTFIKSNLVSKSSIALLEAAIRPPANPKGLSVRALRLRTVLSKGGTATTRAVFGTSTKARRAVQEAIDASMIDDPDAALNKFAALTLKNKKLERWIDDASTTVVPGAAVISPVQEATRGATDASASLLAVQVSQEARPGTDQSLDSRSKHAEALSRIESQATEAAKKAMLQAGEDDRPLTKAEVIGVATAAAAAVTSDPDRPQNVPQALQKLDPEQRAAALTGGRVRVSAGAGSGKSTTLLARTQYLIDHGAVPNRMVAMSFNTKAANELAIKMASKIGSDKVSTSKSPNPNGIRVGTMHGTFLKYINDFGTKEQVDVFAKVNGRGGLVSTSTLFKAVKDIWKDCFDGIDKDAKGNTRDLPDSELWKMPPKSGRMMAYINHFQGEGMSAAEARKWADEQKTLEADQAAKFFEVYEGLKGAFGPSWRPKLCGLRPTPKFEKFVSFYRAGKPRIGDFNDMLAIFRDVMKGNPVAKRKVQDQFDHVMVDECQDLNPLQFEVLQLMTEHIEADDPKRSFWMVGDDKQCVLDDTPVATPAGMRRAADLVPGDTVLAYRNGKVAPQTVRHVAPSSWKEGIKITTESGRTLTMSPNHKIWASSPDLGEGQKIVYLMYRPDLGFRVGVTDRCDGGYNPFGSRTSTEGAERLWILAVAEDEQAALLAETSFSLKYGVPTCVFNGETMGLNQSPLNQVFAAFGKNGGRILEDMHLSFDLPNWVATSKGVTRRTIQMIAHAAGGTQVSLEWSGDDLDEALKDTPHTKLDGDRRRLRKWFSNYRSALEFAETLKVKTKANLCRRMSTAEEPMPLITAGGLLPGMHVLVQEGETVVPEKIVATENVSGTFVDIDVEDASNFFGGGILSHNSIYQFRGADPNAFIALDKMGFKDRQITTNYRCAPEFVDAANKLIANNQNQIPMEAKAAPNRARGEADLTVSVPLNEAKAAVEFGKKILAAVRNGEPVANYAVLARTNAELVTYQQMCAVLGIPFVQKKGASVFASQETETFRALMTSVASTDPEMVQKSFCQTLMSTGVLRPKLSPNRDENVKFANKAMQQLIRSYCAQANLDIKTFNPVEAARTRPDFFKQVLTQIGNVPPFRVEEEMDRADGLLEGISMLQGDLEKPGFTSKDLFEGILALPVIELIAPDPGSRMWTHKISSFKEATRERLAARVAAEEADEDPDLADEKENLGTLEFVKMMMEPNEVDPSYNPLDPKQFQTHFEGLADRAEELRIDPDEYERQLNAQGVPLDQRKPPPGVYLGTVHSTKGAEWDDVTLLMPKGKFPMERKPRKPQRNEIPEVELTAPQDRLESERRLGYVGLTRAKKSLTVLCPGGPSDFVKEAGLNVGQNVPKPEALTPGAESATSAEVVNDEALEWEEAKQEALSKMEKTAATFSPWTYSYNRSA